MIAALALAVKELCRNEYEDKKVNLIAFNDWIKV